MKRVNKKELILGAAGALFMMMGDLALSIVTPDNADEGLFLREAYLPGNAGSFIWFMDCLFLPDDFKYNRNEQKSKTFFTLKKPHVNDI